MKLGPFRFSFHRHRWEKVILFEQNALSMGADGYLLKVAEKCLEADCDAGRYRSVYFIYCKNKPGAYSVK